MIDECIICGDDFIPECEGDCICFRCSCEINADYEEDIHRVDDFINKVDMPWRNYHDGEKLYNKIVMVFYIRRFPSNIILGRDGKIAALGVKTADLEEILADLVNKP